jgi:CubicO group peptidase (beta-lactamase class C family)
MYNPIGPPGQPNGNATLLARIAPTEVDTFFRRRQVHGFVHDENAYAIGGVSGHAGLFSSARDLAVFAQMMLNRGSYNGVQLISEDVIDQFRKRANDMSSRALGWDTPTACGNVSSGSYFSSNSIGHTGFTGTSVWIDYDRDLFVVLLTNRVNPTRENTKIGPLRSAVADAAEMAITDQEVKWRCQ